MGCSYDAIYKYSEAKESYERAEIILEMKLAEIEYDDNKPFDPEEIPNNADREEYKNISQEILPELKEMIIDAENSLNSANTTGINHLVKRKKKSCEVAGDGDNGEGNGVPEDFFHSFLLALFL